MRSVHLSIAMLLTAGFVLAGCGTKKSTEKPHPATVEETSTKGIMRVTLEPKAVERVGIEMVVVREEMVALAGNTAPRKVVPYGAIMYDKKGGTWTFTSPAANVFVREPVTVETIVGDQVVLSSGPAAGTQVVTVGAAELMGAEHKYGH